MGLVIDTNIFIDAENGCLDLRLLDSFSHHDEVFISVITVTELLTGVHMAASADVRVRRSAFVEGVIGSIPILDFTEAVARTYAEIHSFFVKSGAKRKGDVHDWQIAATAITHGFPLLTSNSADFNKIPGLTVESPVS